MSIFFSLHETVPCICWKLASHWTVTSGRVLVPLLQFFSTPKSLRYCWCSRFTYRPSSNLNIYHRNSHRCYFGYGHTLFPDNWVHLPSPLLLFTLLSKNTPNSILFLKTVTGKLLSCWRCVFHSLGCDDKSSTLLALCCGQRMCFVHIWWWHITLSLMPISFV